MMETMAKQFEKPKGLLGKLAGMIMYFENRKINKWSIQKLQLRKQDNILEIGYGPGFGIKTMMDNYPSITVDGIDLSAEMHEEAAKRNQEWIKAGRLTLSVGDVVNYNPAKQFSKILSVNNYPLWNESTKSLKHLYVLMEKGGRIVLTVQPREEGATDQTAKQLGERIKRDLVNAGFKNPAVFFKKVRPVLTVSVTAQKE
jgi:cyclopropane fatty-acyl-phospholipid synthase-like methyltransferase